MRTLVIGVSLNADRYANRAVCMLLAGGHDVVALGTTAGESDGVVVQTGQPKFDGIDTVTLYINPTHQAGIADYVISLKPRRIIFNPGAENASLAARVRAAGIEPVEACTQVLLSTGQF
jgi:uncharacterized protein